ncbi:MAG: 5-formyltetrahydrofolate cyclo-ligase [Bacteroidales bacterium]|nr:5-formyltetrahydrofolate cyclo-ligase [Bacteroidales bacterium]
MRQAKSELRAAVRQLKQQHTPAQLAGWSSRLLERLEDHPAFRQARTVLAYYALPDEVQTQAWIERWKEQKEWLLPVVKGDDLELRRYTGRQDLRPGAYGIEEPVGQPFTDYDRIDLVLVPGVSFDAAGNRLGRGKGYYDRLLPRLPRARRIGICFGFQLSGHIPTEPFDLPMHEVWTENGSIPPTYEEE